MKIKRNEKGFTLVEIAIVMVIIGLLIGGVLKGQAMIQNAKVKRVVKLADEIRAGVMSFYDKYGKYPGDENINKIPPGDTHTTGNGNGKVTDAERYELFHDLQLAGLVSGSYNGTSDFPKHPFGDDIHLGWMNPGTEVSNHYFRLDNLPSEVCMAIDAKYDDGIWNKGTIMGAKDYKEGEMLNYFYLLF